MFQQFNNIDSAFKLSRLLAIIAIAGSIQFSCFIAYLSQKKMTEKEKSILVIANGKIFEAFSDERQKYWPIEIEDHVKTFHFNFFTLQPDETAIKKTINIALFLADNSAVGEYNNLRESGYYNDLIAANASQEIEMDKIEINLNVTPWYFKYTGRIKVIRSTNEVTRSIISEGVLRTIKPTSNNPHGLIIEKWKVLENKDIKTSNR